MRQEAIIEFEGMFWLPEQPERRVRGKLRIEPGRDFTLRLEDHLIELNDPTGLLSDPGRDYEMICGDTFDNKRLCLVDAFTSSTHGTLFGRGPHIKEEVFAHRILVGTHDADPGLTSMTLVTPNLVAFMAGRPRPFSVEGFGSSEGMTVGWSDPGTALSVEVDGFNLTIKPAYDGSVGQTRAVIENAAVIRSTNDAESPASDHERLCESLKLMVEFFSLCPAKGVALTGKTSDDSDVEIFKLEHDVREKGKREWLSRRHIADRFEEVFSKWMGLQERDAILCGALRDLVNGLGGTTDRALWALRFVERFQAIKLEQDGKSDDTYFQSRYKAALETFGNLFDPLLGNPELPHEKRVSKFTETARDTRVLYAHLAVDGPEVLLEGRDQHYLYERVWLLARACILEYLGFSQEEIRSFITQDRQFTHVAEQPLRTDVPEVEETRSAR